MIKDGLEIELPKEPGWYAAWQCWDPQEGAFPSAIFFDGKTVVKCIEVEWDGTIVDCDDFNYIDTEEKFEEAAEAYKRAESLTNW